MRHPPLQAPLLWQTYMGFWIAGITAAAWPWPSFCCALLLLFADSRLWRPARLCCAALCLLAGLFTGHWQLFGGPLQGRALHAERPPWLAQWQSAPHAAPRICGTVRDVRGLPDDRLRLLLEDVRPERPNAQTDGLKTVGPQPEYDDPRDGEAQALPGFVAWTWEAPVPGDSGSASAAQAAAFSPATPSWMRSSTLPQSDRSQSRPTQSDQSPSMLFRSPALAGQIVCLARRPIPAQGFANEGQTDWGLTQAARGVRWRVWSTRDTGQPKVFGQPSPFARWREALRLDFLAALLPAPKAEGGEPLAQNHAAGGYASFDRRNALPQGKAILPALLFGDRRFLTQHTMNNFAAATLAHSLALSGQHLAVAGLLGLLCVLAAARARPGIYLRRPRAVWALLATLPPAMIYLWLGDAPASLLRAAIMLAFFAVWLLRGRALTTIDALCAALCCISVASPLSVLDTGLQLSVLCVAVIGMSLPWLRILAPAPEAAAQPLPYARLRRALRALLRIFLVSLCIQAALLPLNMLLFNNMGGWFWLNVLWLPVADMLVLPAAALGLLLAASGFGVAARAALDVAAMPCQWLTDGLAWLAGAGLLHPASLLRPHWTALPAFAALLTALVLKAGRPTLPPAARRLLLAGALLLCVGPALRTAERLSGDIRLDVLDVGQSQALALRLPGHVRLLLDGGGSASPRFDPGQALVAPALTYNDGPRLSAVLNSHPDIDHMGGLLYVLRAFSVGRLLDNGREGSGERGRQWRTLRQALRSRPLARGDVLVLGDPAQDLRLEILHPPREEQAAWQGNDASLVARLTCNGRGLALFPGDAERPVLRRLLDNGDDLRAEVVVAPHHGSKTGFLKEFYRAAQPGLVVASCGFENRYGYPAQRLRAWCDEAGIPLLQTGRDGAVHVVWHARRDGFDAWRAQRERP